MVLGEAAASQADAKAVLGIPWTSGVYSDEKKAQGRPYCSQPDRRVQPGRSQALLPGNDRTRGNGLKLGKILH